MSWSLDPRNWSACFFLGKIQQRLGDHGRALEAFLEAIAIVPGQVDALREASIAAGRLGRFPLAAALAAKAVSEDPEDAGLRMNVAYNLVLCGEPGRAKAVAADALRRAVDDSRIAAGHALIVKIESGDLPQPTSVDELEELLVV